MLFSISSRRILEDTLKGLVEAPLSLVPGVHGNGLDGIICCQDPLRGLLHSLTHDISIYRTADKCLENGLQFCTVDDEPATDIRNINVFVKVSINELFDNRDLLYVLFFHIGSLVPGDGRGL
jgi:hypothetical protein